MPEVVAPGHSYVDYRGYTKSQERVLRSFLLADALKRGQFLTQSSLQ